MCTKSILVLLFIAIPLILGISKINENDIREIKELYAKYNAVENLQGVSKVKIDGSYIKGQFKYSIVGSDNKNRFNSYYQVYIKNRKMIRLDYFYNGPDDSTICEYYFYSSNELAFIFSKSVLFNGYNVAKEEIVEGVHMIEKRKYFNRNSVIIRSLTRAYNIKNNKPVDEKWFKSSDNCIVYKNVKELPFVKQLNVQF